LRHVQPVLREPLTTPATNTRVRALRSHPKTCAVHSIRPVAVTYHYMWNRGAVFATGYLISFPNYPRARAPHFSSDVPKTLSSSSRSLSSRPWVLLCRESFFWGDISSVLPQRPLHTTLVLHRSWECSPPPQSSAGSAVRQGLRNCRHFESVDPIATFSPPRPPIPL